MQADVVLRKIVIAKTSLVTTVYAAILFLLFFLIFRCFTFCLTLFAMFKQQTL